MELLTITMKLLTAAIGFATALVKLYIQSTEQKRTTGEKEAPDAGTSEAHTRNGTAR
ncbi:hypothetical protein PZH32_10225 [Adlercreutzia equolifaciens]|uniref:hypothetical protein n=1 Tax=Adlercreutzia equolifaciens TaxID=446660 RepID=UPI0023B130BB|nr:hypothetical protein [Adlercreutzia equolifaciens]MDE8703333.1 hypothetical protein [Adlercreutzia equolifaciens]